jgi:hypothetical protein
MTEPQEDTEATGGLDKAELAERAPGDAKFPGPDSGLPKPDEDGDGVEPDIGGEGGEG